MKAVIDYREGARRKLPHMLFEYIDSGSYAETTLRANTGDFQKLRLRQRVMRDMSELHLNTQLFGQALSMPVLLGPVGFAGMYARRGEVQAARAAQNAGSQFCLSALSICDYREVNRSLAKPAWFQLYMIKDRAYMEILLNRVRDAGAEVLVFTVDLPTPGARYRDQRSGLFDIGLKGLARQAVSGLLHPSWLWDVWLRGRPHSFGNFDEAMGDEKSLGDYWEWVRNNFDAGITWRDLEWVRSLWPGKIIIKGVLHPEEAIAAVESGADGLVVSNHGGRQLDGVRSSISALPDIVDAVDDRVPLLMDGGVRSGLDVLKALALGAKGCLLGRAWAYALAAEGQTGVADMLQTIESELRTAMVLTGCATLTEAGSKLLDRP